MAFKKWKEREEKAAMNNSIILTMHIKCMSSGSGAQTNPACVHLNNVVKHKKNDAICTRLGLKRNQRSKRFNLLFSLSEKV